MLSLPAPQSLVREAGGVMGFDVDTGREELDDLFQFSLFKKLGQGRGVGPNFTPCPNLSLIHI